MIFVTENTEKYYPFIRAVLVVCFILELAGLVVGLCSFDFATTAETFLQVVTANKVACVSFAVAIVALAVRLTIWLVSVIGKNHALRDEFCLSWQIAFALLLLSVVAVPSALINLYNGLSIRLHEKRLAKKQSKKA